MGNFIESNLGHDEKIIYKAEVHWMVYSTAVINIILALVVYGFGTYKLHMHSPVLPILSTLILLIAAYKFVSAYFHRNFTEIAVTNKRIIAKFGVIGRESIELPLTRIESVIVEQTPSERMIDAGSIAVRGTGIGMAPIKFIEEPMKFRNALNEAIAEAKQSN